jgi:hypothetical protein
MENHFALETSALLTESDSERFHLITPRRIEAALIAGEPELVVLGNWVGDWRSSFQEEYRKLLRAQGYRMINQIAGAEVYRPPER